MLLIRVRVRAYKCSHVWLELQFRLNLREEMFFIVILMLPLSIPSLLISYKLFSKKLLITVFNQSYFLLFMTSGRMSRKHIQFHIVCDICRSVLTYICQFNCEYFTEFWWNKQSRMLPTYNIEVLKSIYWVFKLNYCSCNYERLYCFILVTFLTHQVKLTLK